MASWGDRESPSGIGEAIRPAAPGDETPSAHDLDSPPDFSLLLSVADALPVMVAYCDTNERYRFVNKPIADWFERERGDILGKSVREVMGEQAYAARGHHLQAALAGEKQWFAAEFEHPTRGMLTTQARYTPHLENGAVVGVVMVVQDITEQRAAEQALRESEARFRRIADSAPIPIWVSRRDGTCDFINEAFADMFGLSPEEARAAGWHDQISDEDREDVRALVSAASNEASPYDFVARFEVAGGETRWLQVDARPRIDAEGRLVGYIGVANDVTVARRDEQRLRAYAADSDLRLRAIFNSVQTVIVLMDEKGTVLETNARHTDWRPHGDEGEIGKPIWETPTMDAYPDHVAELKRLVARAASGETVSHDVTLEAPGRPVSHLSTTIQPVHDEDGKLHYLLLESRDVTQLRQAQDQLRQAQKMEALGQLTGGIAHDFNNLLTVVVGGLDMIAKRIEDEKLLRYATNALAAAERGARLTGQLLAFSRVQRLEVRPTDIGDLVEEMRPLLRNVLGPGIEKEYDLQNAVPWVMADPTQLEVALLNVAINARDAMPEGGTLTIAMKTRNIEDDPVLEDGDYVELSVTDTGHGMDEDVLARVFEPFFTTKEVGKGTGLGLSMVYGMARQSGGTARVESRPGEGTVVRLYFRCVEGRHGRDDERSDIKQRAAPSDGRSVLVIDDDEVVRAFIVESLKDYGFSVREAVSGRDGLDAFAEARPDMVILDYIMPGMSGAEVADAILEMRPEQPILFVSGYSETDAIRAAAPHAGFLPKPFKAETLVEAIRAVCSGC
ncbi:PAS domain-containing protein [Sphingomicrobium nitratireducens]|uniref:PAS domain-containing protein n=1 Tax=Sphingomicrobium nitratireducens TaxID=2964666 RepID=UPI00223FE5CF|nr:PAS domain-containing protein [Sphingomicrobium nitratireducens]